ncbi:MAG: hypothetical protein KJO29_09895, partial [Bacteroidia bacterium]|nr:hypothetical protein [Bacteroidia bacterium]
TGSGKTGLCIGLLEEAAIDQVPAIIIDPKGDMTNLLLQFDGLDASDFQKWINADDAGRKGMSVDDYAKSTAEKWKNGLASWGQGDERIQKLKNAVDYTIYTPKSDSGVPVNILGSFAAPGIDFESDAEMLRERIQGTVAALLGMIGSKEDPSRSREGILLSTLFEHYWKNNEDLDLASLIKGIQKPPFQQLGVFDIDTFFPEKDRFEMAMAFNTLVASPQFAYWLMGDPLDIDKMYFTAEGKPRHSIFYIAHLSESERMFFVTLLLNSLITWMRRQSGTTSLRSLLYFDEIFGYFPPTANPPSKKPLLTILKQARAFGVGSVLVTQNPVDIDYKGLSNAGTWFIGKLQTERDKMRVLEGLEGAIAEAGSGTEKNFSEIITGLSSRVFLMHNVHDDEPVVYHTRWVMSYLRGPMTRTQVKELMKAKKETKKSDVSLKPNMNRQATSKDSTEAVIASAPNLDPAIMQKYFAAWKTPSEAESEMKFQGHTSLSYEPHILATSQVRFYDNKRGVDEVKDFTFLASPPDDFGRIDWDEALKLSDWKRSVMSEPDHPENISIGFQAVAESMNTAKELKKVEDDFEDYLYQNERHYIHEHQKLDMYQHAGESDEAFAMRVQQKAREERDDELDDIKDGFEKKFDRVRERIRREEQDLEEAEAEVRDRRTQEVVGVAETLFSVFVKGRSRSFSSAASKRRMSRRASMKVKESQEDLEELQLDFEELEKELQEKLELADEKWTSVAAGITKKEVKPRRTDIKVDQVMLVWYPYWINEKGDRVSAV